MSSSSSRDPFQIVSELLFVTFVRRCASTKLSVNTLVNAPLAELNENSGNAILTATTSEAQVIEIRLVDRGQKGFLLSKVCLVRTYLLAFFIVSPLS